MKNLRDILAEKGATVYSVGPKATVHEALEKLAAYNIGALIVLDEDNALVGIFSERDYARNGELLGKNSKETLVGDVMTAHLCKAELQMEIEEVMAMMTRVRCRHLPVLDNGALVGLISIGDVVKALLGEKQFLIKQLEQYIAGGL